MFLFSNAPVGTRESTSAPVAVRAPATPAGGGGNVVDAIREGAARSGVGFDYLLATARRESALNPSAKAATSSATGLYQFIEQTWLGVMKNSGPKLGLSSYAAAITERSDGTYAVADPAARQMILDLRRDPRVSAAMAGEFTQRNREVLSGSLGREPTSGDLYVAHVLGARGAVKLIDSAQRSPDRIAAQEMPEAAAANRSLFYDRSGRPRGVGELYAVLSGRGGNAAPTATPTATVGLQDVRTAYAALDSGLQSMFQTDRRQGAVSDGVAKIWQGRAAAHAARPAPSYFPRSDGSFETETVASTGALAFVPVQPAPTTKSSKAVLVPMPPMRPSDITVPDTHFAEFGSTLDDVPTTTPAALAVANQPMPSVEFPSYAIRNRP